MIQIYKLALCVLVIAFTLGCNSNKTRTETSDSVMLDTASSITDTIAVAGVEVGGAIMVPSKNIVENAMNSSDHTTLVAAIKSADLATTLSRAGPFTVFAPTNEAFNKLSVGKVDSLLKPDMKKELQNILTYHVVSGSYKAADFRDGMELTSVQGGKLKISVKDGYVMVNNAKISIADVVSSNGITHVIDSVLVPVK